MVPPRNATSRRPPVGQPVQVPGEVADDAAHPQARVVGGDLRRRPRAARSPTRPAARTCPAPPCRVSASSSSRVFSDEPEPSSTSVFAPVSAAIVGGVLGEDRPLGPGRVVLRQPGDLLEQLAAPGVVEPLRRQPLRRRRSARRGRRSRSAAVQVRSLEVDLQRFRGHRFALSRPTCVPPVQRRSAGRTASAVATTSCPSGTGRQPGSSSSGSEATSTDAGRVARTDSACPTVVATTVRAVGEQQVEPRPGGGRGDRRRPSRPTASAGSAPARSRCRTSAHSSAESVGASRVSRSRTGSAGGERRPPRPASRATTPLWLNSHRPSANGAAARLEHRHADGGRAHRRQHRAGRRVTAASCGDGRVASRSAAARR